jgi:hypothetical protein
MFSHFKDATEAARHNIEMVIDAKAPEEGIDSFNLPESQA